MRPPRGRCRPRGRGGGATARRARVAAVGRRSSGCANSRPCATTYATSPSPSPARPTTTSTARASATPSRRSAMNAERPPVRAVEPPSARSTTCAAPGRCSRRLLDDLPALADDEDARRPLVSDDSGFRLLTRQGGRRRYVYRTSGSRVTVWAVAVAGARRDGAVYAETMERMQAADPSEIVAAARLVGTAGARVTGTAVVPAARRREPVPDWLAERLVAEVGRTRIAVAVLDAATAFDEWNRFLTEPAESAVDCLSCRPPTSVRRWRRLPRAAPSPSRRLPWRPSRGRAWGRRRRGPWPPSGRDPRRWPGPP